MGYYRDAMRYMRSKYPGCHFYVFSDDPDWWRVHGEQSSDIELIRSHRDNFFEDFQMMTLCRHFIIACSSFSWWAAWLGSEIDKLVIAPECGAWSNPDVLLENWIKLPIKGNF
jgi:hypothetical protein